MPGSPRSPQRQPLVRARRRWLVWLLGAIGAAAALWALFATAPPLDEIDAASRAQLEEALREAERAEPAP